MNDQLWMVVAGVLGGVGIGFGLSLMWVEKLIVKASEAAVEKLMNPPIHTTGPTTRALTQGGSGTTAPRNMHSPHQ